VLFRATSTVGSAGAWKTKGRPRDGTGMTKPDAEPTN